MMLLAASTSTGFAPLERADAAGDVRHLGVGIVHVQNLTMGTKHMLFTGQNG